MNENQLGGFMVMTSPVLLGLALDAKAREQRIAWGLGAALCTTACVLSFSRGTIGALGLAIALLLALYARRLDRNQWAVFPAAARWLNVAQSLAPFWTAPHSLAAGWLFPVGKSDQALVELWEAESLPSGSARQTICGLLRQAQDSTIALRTAPRGTAGVQLLDRSARCLPLQSPAAIAVDEKARRLDPNAIGPVTRQARSLLATGRPADAATC
jgi:hypothetical protein